MAGNSALPQMSQEALGKFPGKRNFQPSNSRSLEGRLHLRGGWGKKISILAKKKKRFRLPHVFEGRQKRVRVRRQKLLTPGGRLSLLRSDGSTVRLGHTYTHTLSHTDTDTHTPKHGVGRGALESSAALRCRAVCPPFSEEGKAER